MIPLFISKVWISFQQLYFLCRKSISNEPWIGFWRSVGDFYGYQPISGLSKVLMSHKLWLGFLRVVQTQVIAFFEINVGKGRIRHRKTLNFNHVIFNRFWVDVEIHQSISKSFYVLSDLFRHWFQKQNGFGLNYLEMFYIKLIRTDVTSVTDLKTIWTWLKKNETLVVIFVLIS